MHYAGKELSGLLAGAQPFFAEEPPPGRILKQAQAALPPPSIQPQSQTPDAAQPAEWRFLGGAPCP